MKDKNRKHIDVRLDAFWKWAVLSTVLAMLIHIIFYVSAPAPFFEAKWGAGDLLSYISTIILAWVAYKQNERYKEDSEKFQEAQDKIANDTNEKFKQIQQDIEKQVKLIKEIETKKLLPIFCIGAKLGDSATIGRNNHHLYIRLDEQANAKSVPSSTAHLKNLGSYGILNISCSEMEIDGTWKLAKTSPEYFTLDPGEVCLVDFPLNLTTNEILRFRFEVTNILGEQFHIEYELSRKAGQTRFGKIVEITPFKN